MRFRLILTLCLMIPLTTTDSRADENRQSSVVRSPATDLPDALGEEDLWTQIDEAASESRTFGKPKFSMEYQFDTRGFNTLNVTGSAALPYGFNVWGFVDFESPDGGLNSSRSDLAEHFIEIDLKRKLGKDYGVVLEVNDAQGVNDSLGRVGLFYIPQWDWLKQHNVTLFFKGFPYETDGQGGQMSFAWNLRFPDILDGRFSMGGFLDINIDSGARDNKTNVVADHQFRYRLVDGLHLLIELRYNEFLGANRDFGVGFGVQHQF